MEKKIKLLNNDTDKKMKIKEKTINILNIEFIEESSKEENNMVNLKLLKEINIENINFTNSEDKLFIEYEQEIENMNKELLEFKDVLEKMGELVFIDNNTLNELEDSIVKTTENIEKNIIAIEEATKIIQNENKYNLIKFLGIPTVSCLVFGGFGSFLGIIPAIVGAGIGLAAGGLLGSASVKK